MPPLDSRASAPGVPAPGPQHECPTPTSSAPTKRRGRKSRRLALEQPYSLYRHRDTGRWHIRYTCPLTRKRRAIALRPAPGHPATQIESEAAVLARAHWQEVHEKRMRIAHGLEPTAEVRVALLIEPFLEAVLESPHTVQHKRQVVRHIRRWCQGTAFARVADVRLIDAPLIRQWTDELLKQTFTRRRPDGRGAAYQLSRKAVRAHLASLSAFFVWLRTQRHHAALANPVAVGKLAAAFPRSRRPANHVHSPAEMQALLEAMDQYPYDQKTFQNRAIGYTWAYTGARISEILALAAADIDLVHDLVWFTSKKLRQLPDEPVERRAVPLWPALRAVLLPYMRLHGLGGADLLFPKTRGRRRGTQRTVGPYTWLQSIYKLAGVTYKGGLHVSRHTYVSIRGRMHRRALTPEGHVVTLPVSWDDVQSEVGHVRGSSVTRRIYEHAMRLGPLQITVLDWPAIARAVARARATAAGLAPQGSSRAYVLTRGGVGASRRAG